MEKLDVLAGNSVKTLQIYLFVLVKVIFFTKFLLRQAKNITLPFF